MGFFSELKEDLSQAVNELVPEEAQAAERKAVEKVNVPEQSAGDSLAPETAEDLSRMLDNMDLNLDVESETMAEETVTIPEEEPEAIPEIASEVVPEIVPEAAEEEPAVIPEVIPEIVPETEVEEIPEIPYEEPQAVVEDAYGEPETVEEINEKQEEEVQVEETQYMEMETERTELEGEVVEETALITAGMTIRGDIASQGSMDVIGTVIGNIDVLGKLNITGTIEGASKAADVYAEKARINGDIHSTASIKIGQNTIIIGSIFATSAVIAGAVKGDIDVKGPVILDTSAIVMGNIKSKSVQINNGAVIEGLCSQCYADVSPSSFFEDIKKARK